MNIKYAKWALLCAAFIFSGCRRLSSETVSGQELIRIIRFDEALYKCMEEGGGKAQFELAEKYPEMTEALGRALFDANAADSAGLFDQLFTYYSEPSLKALYKEAVDFYSEEKASIAGDELSRSFKQLKQIFPLIPAPAVYFHVSGLQQNIIVADSLLSCSIDKYLGEKYPLYKTFFPEWQRRAMTPERVATDCIGAWIRSEFPFRGKNNVLLERMVYEGKIRCLVMEACGKGYQQTMSLTAGEYDWCMKNEEALWTYIIERKHLYDPDITTTAKYFQPAPSTFIADGAPGNLGVFIGYRIVSKYMKRSGSTFQELMKTSDAQGILTQSKYKP